MADSQQELNKLISILEKFAKQATNSEYEVRRLVDAFKEISGGATSLDKALQAVVQLNAALAESGKAERWKNNLQEATVEALKFAEAVTVANKRVEQASTTSNAGRFSIPTKSTGELDLKLRTMGSVVPGSAGLNVNSYRGVEQALKQLENDYKDINGTVQNVTASVDQLTGRIMVQAEIVKDLGKGVKQTIPVSSTYDPMTGESSSYTEAQNAFIQQAGGIQRAEQMLSQYGLQVRNVTGFYKDLNSNVARFSVVGTDGIQTSMGAMDQFGNATLHAARNAQTLLQNIGRNVAKVLEWSVATGLVYAVMNSLMQAARELDDIEETMTDISIATGAAGDELQRFYDTALATANLTGVDVTETLEAQAKAFRAAASEADRFSAANVLLKDSLILARLSGMQQAEALDTLVAALRQTGMSLTSGEALLDKWVKTSQNAGVSIQDLAQSFAITSDVASTVGVNVDELNGLIATLAEKTILSSTEIGNALRTLFSNITSDEAVKALQEVGIAVENVDGSMRDWMEINQNIVDLMNSDALSDEQLNRLANALGGGSRRGPQLLALWSNFGRVGDIAADSMDASGNAADAMAAKLDTLQAAVNEMHNAFNELVQSLGYEGGFLELAIDAIKITTDLVRAISSVADTFDGAASSITGAVLAFVALQRIAGAVNWQGMGGGVPTAGQSRLMGVANFLGRTPTALSGQAGVQGMVGGSSIIAGEIAIGIANHEAWNTVGARVGGSLIGSFVGGMLGGSTGGAIGAFIADAMVRSIQDKQQALQSISSGELQGQTPEEILAVLTKGFGKSAISPSAFGYQTGSLFNPRAEPAYNEEEILQLVNKAVQAGVTQTSVLGITGGPGVGAIQAQGFSQAEAQAINNFLNNVTPDQLGLAIEGIRQYNSALAAQTSANQTAAASFTPTTARQIGALISGDQGQALGAEFQAQRNALISQSALTGDTQQLNQTAQAMDSVTVATASFAVALGKAAIAEADYIELGNLLLNATDAERERIVNLTSAINNLNNEIERRQNIQGRGGRDQRTEELIAERDALRAEAEAYAESVERAAAVRFARENYRGFTRGPEDAQGNLYSSQTLGFDKLKNELLAMQDQYVSEVLGIDPEAFRASITDPMIIAFADGYKEIEGLHADFAGMLLDKMKEVAEEMADVTAFSFRDLGDMSVSSFDQIRSRAKFYEQFLEKNYGPSGYQEDKQNVGLLFEGNQARTLNTTMTALNLAIEELVEVEKKQLEGMWNLPSGATAYVPITSLFYQQQNQMGNTQFDPAANKMDNAANTMERAANLMAYASSNAAEGAIIAQNRAKDNIGNKMPYASASAAEGATNVDVRVEPQNVRVTINGREVANAVARYNAAVTQNASRSRGRTKVAI